ncbi:protein of unknown function [Paraburkholderia kururiensis]
MAGRRASRDSTTRQLPPRAYVYLLEGDRADASKLRQKDHRRDQRDTPPMALGRLCGRKPTPGGLLLRMHHNWNRAARRGGFFYRRTGTIWQNANAQSQTLLEVYTKRRSQRTDVILRAMYDLSSSSGSQ